MALIPITFKADIPDNKKGNIRAEDFSALLSFGLSKDAGILNITGQDCSAFGNINVVGSTAQVTFHKGYVVIFGRAIYVEEGTQFAFNLPSSGTVNGVLGIKVNLAESGANEVSWFQKTTTPQIDDLLNKNADGVYEFVIYNYTATPNSFSLSEENKTTQIIKNIKDADFITRNNDNKSKNIATTEFVHNLINSNKVVNKVDNGSMKLDNGIIVKWGFARTPSGVTKERMAFDPKLPYTKVFSIVLTPIDTSNIDRWVQLTGYDNAGFNYAVYSDRTDVFYIAIGV